MINMNSLHRTKTNLQHILTATVSAGFLLAMASPAQAQFIYKRVDAQGKTIYSDHIPANAKERYEAYSSKTLSLQKVTERELSESEYMLADRDKRSAEQEQIKADIQRKKDESLLGTYNSLDDIARMKKFELNQLDNSIKNDIEMLARLRDTNSVLDEQIKANKGNTTNERLLEDRSVKNDKDISVLQENIERNRKLYVEKENKYNEDRARFEEVLKTKAAAQNKAQAAIGGTAVANGTSPTNGTTTEASTPAPTDSGK